jgi:SAM-dependent methyltransferase
MTGDWEDDAYRAKIGTELDFYASPEDVDELPPIHYYWAERYCVPLLREVGFGGLNELLDEHVAEQCLRRAPERARLVSLGAGSGETELGIAERLQQRGIVNLEILLLELNPLLLERARADAAQRGIAYRVTGVETDLNSWQPDGTADVYFANHSLHHLVALESVFDRVRSSLDPNGVLLVNDMIGRNGHVRWPEAAELVHRVWRTTPERYRWNRFDKKVDEVYPDMDCSAFAFEGVRSQDVLPLLLQRFHADVYVTFLNVADPFLDRIYGPNFDPKRLEDLAFIDALVRFDEAAIDMCLTTPTHLIASFRTQPVECRHPRERSPRRTVRDPGSDPLEPVQTTMRDVAAEGSVDLAASADPDAVHASLNEAWGRYHALRRRRAVRAALALAALGARVRSLGSRRVRKL